MAAIYREGNIFCQALTVPCYDTDAAFRLKPASFMDMAQEIAYWAAQELGFGYDDLQKHHTAWVLSRLHFHYVDPPRWRDEVLLRTWHKGQDGLFFLRDFELLDSSGKRIVSATSSWLVMNVETRHLVRDPQEAGLLHDGAAGAGDAIAEPASKVVMPRDAAVEAAGERLVSYSDVDILGHTNNARYVVWAMDCLPYGEASQGLIGDVRINFNKETVPGDTVALFKAAVPTAQGMDYFVEGRVGGKSVFCVQLSYLK